jgi:predicted glycogen debranching enzyme
MRMVCLRWRASAPQAGAALEVRPLVALRSYHGLQRADDQPYSVRGHEDGQFFALERPFAPCPCALASNGAFREDPSWYYRFRYEHDRERGYDCSEDLFSPGVIRFALDAKPSAVIVAGLPDEVGSLSGPLDLRVEELAAAETKRRNALGGVLDRSAEAYLIEDTGGPTVIAGYPWFTDWGRDTFIALRGLCLASGKLETAASILLRWSADLSDGMMPNRFPDAGQEPEYNSVDSALWFVITACELLAKARSSDAGTYRNCARPLTLAIEQILESYRGGTRFGIRMAHDNLLAAGEPGMQLTWMDAKIDREVITPRIGKPVEIQALWINALKLAAELRPSEWWGGVADSARESFEKRFWNPAARCLYDVVDVDHFPGTQDGRVRPNQLFAAGGLPLPLVTSDDRREALLETVERELLTPVGMRTLAPVDRDYHGRCAGDLVERDRAYHQGTAWPWLMGAFVQAWVAARQNSRGAIREARKRFLPPLMEHLLTAGINHVSEIFDGDAPHTPRGAPFQAWSLAELIRIDRGILDEE